MACFADINVSQGSVATYAMCGGILNIYLTTNLHHGFFHYFFNQSRFDRIVAISLWPLLLAHPEYVRRHF